MSLVLIYVCTHLLNLYWCKYLLPFCPLFAFSQYPKSAFRNNIRFLIVIVLETLADFAAPFYFYLLQMMICYSPAARASELICLTKTALRVDS